MLRKRVGRSLAAAAVIGMVTVGGAIVTSGTASADAGPFGPYNSYEACQAAGAALQIFYSGRPSCWDGGHGWDWYLYFF
jgi:hypothetical protein